MIVSGLFRNIYFSFDVETDTALSVATEMVAELDITDQDVTKIAEMIDGEIASLVPDWKRGFTVDDSPNVKNGTCCENCASDGSISGYLSYHPGTSLHILECTKHACGSVHGRFEEITYQVEGSEPVAPRETSAAQQEDQGTSANFSDKKQSVGRNEEEIGSNAQVSPKTSASGLTDEYENEIRQELRWLKAKYKIQLRDLTNKQLGVVSETTSRKDEIGAQSCVNETDYAKNPMMNSERNGTDLKSLYESSSYGSCSPVHFITANSFYTGALLPQSLHRATSLPVDATDF